MNHKERENWGRSIQLENFRLLGEHDLKIWNTSAQFDEKKKQGLVKNKYKTIT